MPQDMYNRIKTFENEAQDLISHARTEAKQILEDAKKQAQAITTEEFFAEEIEQEHSRIITEAQKKAASMIEDAKRTADDLRKRSLVQSAEVVQMILWHVKGPS